MFFKNRQTSTDLGTGLPFLSKKEYQQRFQDITTSELNGYWEVPSNRLPTFQVWTDFDITDVQIIPVNGLSDGTPITIPVSQLIKKCTDPPLEKIISYTNDDARNFVLPCGLYYIFLEVDNGNRPPLYSEVFLVGGVCGINVTLDYVITQINVDLSADITFTINPDTGTAYASSVNGTPYVTRVFADTLPVGDNTVTIEMDTEYCGVYAQEYIFRNTGGVITVIKQY